MGIAERIDDPPSNPAPARPAATVVLMRDADEGVEVLLLKRVHSAGFVPGAYVFPGGRVDAEDADPVVMSRTASLSMEGAAERMGLRDASPPAAASSSVREVRDRLLDGACSFAQALEDLDVLIDDAVMEYIGHWITPIAEPRRYDARFFAAAVAPGSEPAIHTAEMLEAIWITPAGALKRTAEGSLPMVFPTIKTLESLTDFGTTSEILKEFRRRSIPSVLPRLIRTRDGIGLRIPEIISDPS